MKKSMELVKFNLTPKMSSLLIKFNNLKHELAQLKELYDLDKDEKLLIKIKQIESELNTCRTQFIIDFRNNNHDEIIEYLNLRDQK